MVPRKLKPARGKMTAVFFFCLIVASFVSILLILINSGIITHNTIHFLDSLGDPSLRRTQVRFGHALRFETWKQAAGYSYSVWHPFTAEDNRGNPLRCRLEAEGWRRPQAGRANLLTAYCVCERAQLHHDREVSCSEIAKIAR